MDKWNFDNKIYTLDNGLKVITIKRNTNIAAINIGFNIGSLYENETEKGISHFLEHMMFKGTKTRNNEKLNNELEFLGGDYNAYTDNLATVYSASCLSEEIKNATELLADMVMNSKFDKREIKREKGVVLAEIRSSKDSVEDLSFRRLNEFAFTNSALQYDVLGTEKAVESFTKEQLLEYYKKYYTPDNATFVIVSSLGHDESFEFINNTFKNWEGKCAKKIELVSEKNNAGIFTSYKKQIEQNTITYLYSLDEMVDEDEMPLKILNHKFGESSNSILFRELREKRGLAYDVYTCIDLSKNIRLMNIFIAVGEESLDESLEAIEDVIEDVRNEVLKIDDDMLGLMKKIHKTAVLSTLEDSAELCSYVINQSLENLKIDDFRVDMEKLEKLKKDDITRVANKYLKDPTIHILKSEE
ncbi:pitrilysin family protein [uncultured Clostridium sp.]|uniref:M16 family metallopeptidase n=1 Tax=uncultured Clostridium sp. TaxID=59620 RepID=UPI002613A2B0|nr:pitrilysin family protein [uncultured Clostridium sp.]